MTTTTPCVSWSGDRGAGSGARWPHLPDPPPDPALHAIRIQAKRARYAAEVMEPAFGRPARDFAKALTRRAGRPRRAPGRRGRRRRGCGRRALTLDDPAAAFAAGELGARERVAADESRAAWPTAWRAATQAVPAEVAVSRRRRDRPGPRCVAAGGVVVRRHRRRARGPRSCTGPATTTGASPRASRTRARPTRRPRVREVAEETGFTCALGDYLGEVRYRDHRGRSKIVHYWRMEPTDGRRLRARRRGRPPAVGATPAEAAQTAHLRARPCAAAGSLEDRRRDRLPAAPRPGRSAQRLDGRRRPPARSPRSAARQATGVVDLLERRGDHPDRVEPLRALPPVGRAPRRAAAAARRPRRRARRGRRRSTRCSGCSRRSPTRTRCCAPTAT